MTTRFPLYAKILAWFFVNLAVVGIAGWLLLREQFRFSALPARAASANLERAAAEILGEGSNVPLRGWDAILGKAGSKYGVDFRLCDSEGRSIAGTRGPLPPVVHSRWFNAPRGEPRPRPGFDRPPPDRRDGPPPERRDGPPPDRRDGPPMEGDGPPRDREFERPRRPDGRLDEFIHSTNPDRYWAATRIKGSQQELIGGALLLASSDSATGHGFFFDIRPYVWGGIGVLVLSVLVWLPFVSGLTRSLSRMQTATKQLAEGDFSARSEDHRRDEVGALGGEINRMAARLAGYVAGQKRFLGDVAHELSAPIARLQVAIEILERRIASTEGTRVSDVREEIEHMATLVNDLLQFSRTGMMGDVAVLTDVKLGEITARAVYREAGDTSQVSFSLDPELRVQAVPELLQRAIANVVRNAIRYAGHAGTIVISAEEKGDEVFLSVADNGPGIPAAALPKIFNPFFRIDESRTASTGGTGLGLTIVKSCVEACRGTVVAANREPTGLCVMIKLLKSTTVESD